MSTLTTILSYLKDDAALSVKAFKPDALLGTVRDIVVGPAHGAYGR